MVDKITIAIEKAEGQDHVVMRVIKKNRGGYELINELYDGDARKMYKELTGRNFGGGKNAARPNKKV